MRRLLLACLAAAAPATAWASSLAITAGEAVRVTLPAEAHDVIIGDPQVADVTVADRRHLIITGKAFGQTNIIVTGGSGETLLNKEIVVPAPAIGRVTLIKGPTMVSYACAPVCVQTGESAETEASGPAAAAPTAAPAPVANQH